MKKIRNSKGITLIALIAYIIITLIVLGMLTVLSSNFRNNLSDLDQGTVQDTEFDKLNVQLLKETKDATNTIDVEASGIEGTKIVFTNGNTYEYIQEEKAIYLNDKIKVAGGIESCTFQIETEKNILSDDTEYTDENGDIAIIPAGFAVSGKKSEQIIQEGLVIYCHVPDSVVSLKATVKINGVQRVTEYIPVNDGSINWSDGTAVAEAQKTYDQFVWIPIKNTTDDSAQDINDMYMCQSEDGTKSCSITVQEVDGEEVAYCTTHSSTAMAGRLYATATGETFDAELISQTYKAGSDLREPDSVKNTAVADGNTTNLGYLNTILKTSYSSASDFKTDLQSEYNEIVKSVYKNQGFYVGRYETSNMTEVDGTAIRVVAGTTTGINSINWYYGYAQQKEYSENKGLSVGSTMLQSAAYDQVMKFVNTVNYSVTTVGNVGHSFSSVYDTGSQSTDQSKNIFDLEGNVAAWTTGAAADMGRIGGGRQLFY